MLVARPGFRKPTKGEGELIPVLVLERFDTFDVGRPRDEAGARQGPDPLRRLPGRPRHGPGRPRRPGGRPASSGRRGRTARAPGGRQGQALHADEGPRAGLRRRVAAVDRPDRSSRATSPAGIRLFANGQWSGTLDLKVDAAGGRLGPVPLGPERHRRTRSSGQVSANVPQKVAFTVKYPAHPAGLRGPALDRGQGGDGRHPDDARPRLRLLRDPRRGAASPPRGRTSAPPARARTGRAAGR